MLGVADEVAGHSPSDQLPIEKNTRGNSMMFARPHLTQCLVVYNE